MLDNYYSSTTKYVPYTRNIVEKKAPTDDSIRLYGEFLDKAQKAILDSFIIKGSFLEAVVEVVINPLSRDKHILYKCIINGEVIYGDVPVDWLFLSDTHFIDEANRKVIEDISKKISSTILEKAYIEHRYS